MQTKVLNKNEIEEICTRLAREITEKIKNDEKIPVFVGVLKGSLNFMMDLLKHIETPIFTDYIQISSYCGTTSTGRIKMVKDLSFDCSGRSIIIIEDIVDTGNSMKFLLEHFSHHKPKSIYVCALFNKGNARTVDVKVDFIGKELEGTPFLVGYGLDYYELLRNIPEVYAVEKDDVDKLDEYLKNEEKQHF